MRHAPGSRRICCTLRNALGAEEGTVSVILVLALTAIGGMAALSVDLGRAWNLDTELQNAADAAALACATQLDRKTGARSRGQLAATGALAQNSQTFASDGGGSAVAVTAVNVTFYASLNPDVAATDDATARYCRVNIDPRTVNFSFAQLVGATAFASPAPRATAGMNTAKCKVPPIMICNPNDPNPFDSASRAGQGITLKGSTGASLVAGNFGLLALNDKVLSTNEVRDAWARLRPLAQCFGDQVTTKPGQATAIAQGLNMRFDIYFNGTHQVPPGEPPVRSNPNYVPSMNSVKGLIRTGTQCSLGNSGWKNGDQKYMGPDLHPPHAGASLPAPTAMGFPRDSCAYAGGACDVDASGSHFGDGAWDVDTYMAVNHAGVAYNPIPAGWDLNGDGQLSRYEVYQWELTEYANNVSANENAAPICHASPAPTNPDRRVITVAVVNCTGITGTETVTPIEWVELFLTEPMGVFNGNNDLYGEIIGPGQDQGDDVMKFIVQLVE